jgi:hypothetical protein
MYIMCNVIVSLYASNMMGTDWFLPGTVTRTVTRTLDTKQNLLQILLY